MVHPEPMDAVFKALAHAGRRQVLDLVSANPGCNVGEVCAHFQMSRIGVLKHINVLAQADLLISERQGRERRLYFNSVPIQMVYDRWTSDYSALWAGRLTHLKYEIEQQGVAQHDVESRSRDDER